MFQRTAERIDGIRQDLRGIQQQMNRGMEGSQIILIEKKAITGVGKVE